MGVLHPKTTYTMRRATSISARTATVARPAARSASRLQLSQVATRTFVSGTAQATSSSARTGAMLIGAAAFAGASYYSFASVKADDKVPHTGLPGTRFERTFIAIKPDGVQRGIVGEIIQRFEKKGYKLVGLKVVKPTKQFAEQHYADLSKKPFFPSLVNYFSSGPVVAMVFEGRNAIVNGRKIVGATNPADAEAGSVRGDLCIDIGRNIIHGSDGPESAKDEISLWFKEGELANWESENAKWVYEKL